MLKRFLFCLAALMLFSGVYAAEKSSKNSKAAKKVRKSAEKAAAKKESLEAIPGLPLREANWKGGPNRSWEINFNDAVMKAKAENKKLFVLRSGSDWCPPCKMLERNILSQEAFRLDAAKRVILLHADFPRKRKQSDAEKADARKIAAKYKADGAPTVYLLSPEGVVLDKKVGYINVKPEKYLDLFKGIGK